MPDIAQKNGIDMGNIASINEQTVSAGGGAYDPVAETGTYTETVPTSGLIQMGGAYREVYNETDGKEGGGDDVTGFPLGVDIVRNYSSDVDGKHARAATPFSGTVSKIVSTNNSIVIIDSTGKLHICANSTSYWGLGGTPTGRSFTQATGIGDSDTGWTDVACSSNHTLAINSGKLYAIGANSYGKFGNGTTTASYNSWIQIGTDTDWVSVACGENHSAAIKGTSNVLYTCGQNGDGKTGQATESGNTTSWTAVDATNLVSATNNNFSFVSCSYHHTAGIQSGRAFACGRCDTNEPLGQNYTTDQTIMIQTGSVSGTFQTNWTKIYPNYYSSHLINSSGELYHQGDGQYYLSGDGTTTDHKSGDAVQTSTWTDVEDLYIKNSAYNPSSVVLKRSGKLYYVGYTREGNIPPNITSAYVTSPTLLIDAQINGNAEYIRPDANSSQSLIAQYQ
jgi:hypothetical protein